MSVQWELATTMECLKFLNNSMQLINKLSCSSRAIGKRLHDP